MACLSCEPMMINDVYCHETGCPDAWRDDLRECDWCGCEFTPDNRYARFCTDGCYCQYNNIPSSEGDC